MKNIIVEFWNEIDNQNWNELNKYFSTGAEINCMIQMNHLHQMNL